MKKVIRVVHGFKSKEDFIDGKNIFFKDCIWCNGLDFLNEDSISHVKSQAKSYGWENVYLHTVVPDMQEYNEKHLQFTSNKPKERLIEQSKQFGFELIWISYGKLIKLRELEKL